MLQPINGKTGNHWVLPTIDAVKRQKKRKEMKHAEDGNEKEGVGKGRP
jgi:hypothetical protein